MTYTDEEYLSCCGSDISGDDDVALYRSRMVRVRKDRPCSGDGMIACCGTIKKGEKAMNETFVADGKWKNLYTCMSCLDEWMELSGHVSHDGCREDEDED